MKQIIWYVLIFIVPASMNAQESGAVGVEFNASHNQYGMDEFNKSVDRVNSNSLLILNSEEHSEINDGFGYGLAINLQISQCFNIGLYGNYFVGKSKNDFILISGGEFGTPIDTSYWSRHHEVTSSVIGLKSSFFLSKAAFWKNRDWLSKVESRIDLGVGYSFSKFIFYNMIQDVSSGAAKEVNQVSGIHLKGQLKIGYVISNSTCFSSIGIMFGYQHLNTSRLKGAEFNYYFNEENAPRLNFSGLTSGIYLTFGK